MDLRRESGEAAEQRDAGARRRRPRALPVCSNVWVHISAFSEELRLSRRTRSESRELVHGKLRRPLQSATRRESVHHHHKSHCQGRSLFHSSRPESVPQSHREGGGPPPDVPGQLLFPRQRTQQYIQVGNAVPPFLAYQIARSIWKILDHHDRMEKRPRRHQSVPPGRKRAQRTQQQPRVAMQLA